MVASTLGTLTSSLSREMGKKKEVKFKLLTAYMGGLSISNSFFGLCTHNNLLKTKIDSGRRNVFYFLLSVVDGGKA